MGFANKVGEELALEENNVPITGASFETKSSLGNIAFSAARIVSTHQLDAERHRNIGDRKIMKLILKTIAVSALVAGIAASGALTANAGYNSSDSCNTADVFKGD